jgi:predicted nucleic acid-binding protein
MWIVSNTSPLIILKKANAIFILEKIFDSVLIPEEVRNELFRKEREFFEKLSILKVVKPKDFEFNR